MNVRDFFANVQNRLSVENLGGITMFQQQEPVSGFVSVGGSMVYRYYTRCARCGNNITCSTTPTTLEEFVDVTYRCPHCSNEETLIYNLPKWNTKHLVRKAISNKNLYRFTKKMVKKN